MEPTALNEIQALIVKGEVDAAIHKCAAFLNDDFFHDEALFLLGGCFMAGGMNGLAAVVTSAAIDAREAKGKPFPEALLNLGGCYKSEHNNEMAAKVYAAALAQETLPRERSKILTNIAGLYINEGDPAKALEWCEKALTEDPKNHKAAVNRGMACLELGRWREGWEGWGHTFASGDRTRRDYGEGIGDWDGSPGKTVIVYGDQGVGDEIYFASCIPDVVKISKKVILDCHPRLEALFRRSFPGVQVYGTRKDLTALEWVPDCGADAAICVADLPGLFRNEAADWGGDAYLKAMPVLKTGSGPRIGISWTGGTKRTRIDLRSLPLRALEPILQAREDAQWFSLQYTENAAREVCDFEEHTGVRLSHFPGWVETFDYDSTASFVASLDLVITVCTTVHHLAGSLGVPVWTLVPSRPSWRYQLHGETLPWYKSARLFRQERDGDWTGPIQRVADELSHYRTVSSTERRVA
jgi:tetratricopeptide (TPR) repeat protein